MAGNPRNPEKHFFEFDERTRRGYIELLTRVMSISRMFSENDSPYLHYRLAENIYCHAFGAENIGRKCVAIDARLGDIGIGIKTFAINSKQTKQTKQKIAEFDSNPPKGTPSEIIRKVVELRNCRLQFAKDAYGAENLIYHYIVREEGGFKVYEEPME